MIRDAIRALRAPGGLVLYPTETLYGVGGRAGDALAAHRVAEAKGRGLQPLVVLVDEIPNDLEGLALELAQEFWPGPLTLIVPAPDWVCPEVCAPDGSVGLRWSGHPVVSQLIQAVGPITSTSAFVRNTCAAQVTASRPLARWARSRWPSTPSWTAASCPWPRPAPSCTWRPDASFVGGPWPMWWSGGSRADSAPPWLDPCPHPSARA